MSPNACSSTSPTIACLCLSSMRKGPPLDSHYNKMVASLFVEPLVDTPIGTIGSFFCIPTQHQEDTRKRPAIAYLAPSVSADTDTLQTEAAHSQQEAEFYGNGIADLSVSQKRRKLTVLDQNDSSSSDAPTAVCLLLEARPEVLRYIRSFLNLQDTLTLKSTCKILHNDGYDAYRYSTLLTCKALAKEHFKGPTCNWKFLQHQDHVLMRNQNDEKLRAILRNTFIPSYHLRRFIWTYLKTTKVDVASPILILIEDGRCDVDPFMLDQALRRNLPNIAAVLQQDERLQAGIQMCATCNENIGCFECFRDLDCCVLPDPAQGRIWCSWDDLPPNFRKAKKYCRSCVLSDNTFCKVCSEYLCPECRRCHNHGTCEACHSILCLDDFFTKQPVLVCDECPRIKCRSCLQPEEGWLEVVDGGFPITLCPNCKSSFTPGQIGETEEMAVAD